MNLRDKMADTVSNFVLFEEFRLGTILKWPYCALELLLICRWKHFNYVKNSKHQTLMKSLKLTSTKPNYDLQ
jgi:hypothetical protein